MDYSHGVLKSTCSPVFPKLREQLGPFLVDKTKLIENIINKGLNGNVDLVLRPKCCGKTTMLLMLKSFFCIPQEDFGSHPESIFNGLHIASNHDICHKHMGKYTVIFCDFKTVTGNSWDEMFSSFRRMVSNLYQYWYHYLEHSLRPMEREFFNSICSDAADSTGDWRNSLRRLTNFLAQTSGRGAMVFIDEYEAPINHAFEYGFVAKANEFFGHGVLPPLLKTNDSIEYAILAGVTPAMKAGWYSGLNNIVTHALHKHNSIFAGMLMFTEAEVLSLRQLSKCKLEPEDLKAHYGSYLAAGHISVYNPVSIMSALEQSMIENFWITTGKYPLLHQTFLKDSLPLDVIERLLSGSEVSFKLEDKVSLSICMLSSSTLDKNGALTLLYYAGYLTMTPTNLFKVPNQEVMMDWARWVIGHCSIQADNNIVNICVEGHISTFEERWPNFMLQHLEPKIVTKVQGVSLMTPERIYRVYFLGLMHVFRPKGWELSVELRDGGGYVNIRLISRKKSSAVLVELQSSENPEALESDAKKALEQMVDKNYRNQGLPTNIRILREYGIASHHLASCVKGRYLELNTQSRWVEKDDPATRINPQE